MLKINLDCTNKHCNASLSFTEDQMGTIQNCPSCGQKIFIPENDTLPLEEYRPYKPAQPTLNLQPSHNVF